MPLHPVLVHYPIALPVQSTIFQALYLIFKHTRLSKAALITWTTALVGAVAAALTATAQEKTVLLLDGLNDLLAVHERMANLTIFGSLAGLFYALASFRRNNLNPWIFFAILLPLSGIVIGTGHYGGQLVYLHSAGITVQ